MFDGQSVAVTGANGGIGRAIAEMFIANGAKVAISDINSTGATAAQIGAAGFTCDVGNEESVKAFVSGAQAANGPIDIYVSNAGVGFGDGPHAAGATNQDWETSWQVNMMANVYAARALLPNYIERGSGRFVITASAAGLLNQIGSASYSATKHAAVSFAETIAIEHMADGVKSHCICPQYVKTNMTKGMDFAESNQDGLLLPSDVANALKSAIEEERFLVLSHPIVGEYVRHKTKNWDAWLSGMAKLKQKLGGNVFPDKK